MINPIELILLLITIFTISTNAFPFKTFKNLNEDVGVRKWLNQLVIRVEEIEKVVPIIGKKFKISNLTIERILLSGIKTKPIIEKNQKTGLNITIDGIGFHIFGNYYLESVSEGKLEANASGVNMFLPFKLIKNESSGLISNVTTKGLQIIIDKNNTYVDIKGSGILPAILKYLIQYFKDYIFDIIMDQVKPLFSDLIDSQFNNLFGIANNLILNGAQPIPLISATKKPVDLRKSPIIDSLRFLLDHFTGVDGPLSFNHLFSIISNGTGEVHLHEFYDKKIKFNFNVSDTSNNTLCNIEMGLNDLNISGLNTWTGFQALIPNELSPIRLDSFTNLSELVINITFSIKVSIKNDSMIISSYADLYEEANLHANLTNNTLMAQMQLPSSSGKLAAYTNKDCLNLDCIVDLADPNGTGIIYLNLNETFNNIIITGKEGDLEEDIDNLIDDLIKLFLDNYKSKFPIFLNAILNSTLIDLANNYTRDYLFKTVCPNIPDPDNGEINVPMTTLAISGALFLFFIIIFFPYIIGNGCKKIVEQVRLPSQNEIENISNISRPSTASYACSCGCSDWIKEFGRTDSEGASLFLNPNISLFWRLFIPLGILLNISMFISSNSATGASVYILLTFGRKIKVPSLFDFGLINSVTEMWKAKVYPLSIIIAFFSGIWPYLKLIFMLVSFITPTSILKKRKRESILLFLDATGKWSILDSYVMILMLVAFHFHIKFPIIGKEVTENALIDVYVYAATGFVTLITGTCFSLALSHIITHLHRGLDEHPDQNSGKEAESPKALMKFSESKFFGDILFRIIITFLLFATLILVIIGSYIISFSFNFHGLAGYALTLLNIDDHREYSVLDLGFSVPKSYENPNSKAIRFTQVIYFLTIFVLPILHLIITIILWLVPFSRKVQSVIYSMSEILNAWSCLDVFVVSIIAAVLEIGQFAHFIVGDKCDFINPFIKKYFSETLDGHDTCFEVEAYLQSGCWVLFTSAITYFIASFIVMKVCRKALYERLPQEVKDYLKNKKNENIISKIRLSEDNENNRFSSIRKSDNDINDISNRNTENLLSN